MVFCMENAASAGRTSASVHDCEGHITIKSTLWRCLPLLHRHVLLALYHYKRSSFGLGMCALLTLLAWIFTGPLELKHVKSSLHRYLLILALPCVESKFLSMEVGATINLESLTNGWNWFEGQQAKWVVCICMPINKVAMVAASIMVNVLFQNKCIWGRLI